MLLLPALITHLTCARLCQLLRCRSRNRLDCGCTWRGDDGHESNTPLQILVEITPTIETARIAQPGWIRGYISIQVYPLGNRHGVTTDPPPYPRCVIPSPVVIQSSFLLSLLASIAIAL